MTMTSVSTAELKAHLGKYLRMVRSGETVEVTSHRHPVARLVPRGAVDQRLETITPTRTMRDLKGLKPVKLSRSVDGVSILLEDRRRR